MKILTWNINGIRSIKDDLNQTFLNLDADIICIQETKVTRDMLEENTAILKDFSSYFSFSRKRTGYSGVATFCKDGFTPTHAEEGLTGTLSTSQLEDAVKCYDGIPIEFTADELKALDSEGRSVITQHLVKTPSGEEKPLTLINVYCPRADPEKPERGTFKMKFYKLLEMRSDALRKAGHFVVIVGDVNTSHKQIDHCDPSEEFCDNPGRHWMSHFLSETKTKSTDNTNDPPNDPDLSFDWIVTSATAPKAHQFIDSFRHLHPDREKAFTCWNTKMNCRATNFGTRIDYVFLSLDLLPFLRCCDIHPDVLGSDHCPVKAVLDIQCSGSKKLPSWCSKFFPEFSGRQQKVSSFFSKRDNANVMTGGQKRSNEYQTALKENPVKKLKPGDSNKPKQTNIFNFFKTPSVEATNSNEEKTVSTTNMASAIIENGFQADELATITKDFEKRREAASAWKNLMKGPPPAPMCKGHNEQCVLRTVKKKGPNSGRQFWCCGRGEGKTGDPEAKCDFFKWVKK